MKKPRLKGLSLIRKILLYEREISKYLCFRRITHRLLVTVVFAALLVYMYTLHANVPSSAPCPARIKKRRNISSLIQSLTMKAELRTESTEEKPILTLFTTWPENDTRDENIVTAFNWASLKPYVKPVIFMSQGTLADELLALGLDVLPVTKTAAGDVPVLKAMFLDVVHKYSSHFYGYANSDILFDRGLTLTLSAIMNLNQHKETPLLVVGQRTNVYDVGLQVVNSSNLYHIAENGTLFNCYAEDYFITNSVFPWKDIPDLVVGRVAYDNWLVLHSVERDFSVIDATQTIAAVHQTTCVGNFEGSQRPQGYYNRDLLSKMYGKINYHKGRTTCSILYTEFKKGITISERAPVWGCRNGLYAYYLSTFFE